MENQMENEMEATIMGLYRDYIRVIFPVVEFGASGFACRI